jgi:hypothetical protein
MLRRVQRGSIEGIDDGPQLTRLSACRSEQRNKLEIVSVKMKLSREYEHGMKIFTDLYSVGARSEYAFFTFLL